MLRVIIPIVIGIGLGVLLGYVQGEISKTGFDESFTTSRASYAEEKGQQTAADLEQLASKGTPILEVVGGQDFDFGSMKQGESRSHEFVFRNSGDGSLILGLGGSTCKCTIGELHKSVLEPGEETKVTLTWTAKTLSPEFGQSATITSNDPTKGEVKLTVSGKIIQSVIFEPAEYNFNDIATSGTSTYKFKVFSSLENVDIKALEWTDPNMQDKITLSKEELKLTEEELKDPQKVRGYEVTVEMKPGLRLGPFNSKISFITNLGDDADRVEYLVQGRVIGDIELIGGPSFDSQKNVLSIGTVESSKGAEVRLQLAVLGDSRSKAKPKVALINPSEALEVELGEPRQTESRTLYPIVFRVPKGAPEVFFPGASKHSYGRVEIETGDGLPKVPIHIRLVVRK